MRIGRWQAAFRREGLEPGERIALCARNGVNWVAIDQAALGLGLVVVPLYVDDNPDTARRYEVMSIPTLLVFKDGLAAKRIVGAKGKGQLLQDLAEFIG